MPAIGLGRLIVCLVGTCLALGGIAMAQPAVEWEPITADRLLAPDDGAGGAPSDCVGEVARGAAGHRGAVEGARGGSVSVHAINGTGTQVGCECPQLMGATPGFGISA